MRRTAAAPEGVPGLQRMWNQRPLSRSRTTGNPVPAAEEPEGVGTPSASTAPQEAGLARSERSWWRRFFGFE